MKKNRIVNRTLNGRSPNRSGKRKYISRTLVAAVSCMLSLATFQSALAAVNLANTPVFLKASVDPNLMFIFDDSGSMGWDWMPNSIQNDFTLVVDNEGPFDWTGGNFNVSAQNFWYYSSRVNTVYYNPDTEYAAPFSPDGSGRLANSDFNDAWENGYSETGSINLSTFYPSYRYNGYFGNSAFYYRFNNSSSGCETEPQNNNCYSLVFLADESAEQQQNFANWFSYYRNRAFASRAGITEAFFDLPENIRVGYGAINSGTTDIDGIDTQTIISGVRPYSAARRQQFLSWLQAKNVSGGTPLRRSLQDAGDYFSRDDDRGPWGNEPGTNDTSSHAECRQSYTILMTDGEWNGNSPQVGNADRTAGPSHTNPKPEGNDFNYQAVSPFADDHSNTLADVAMQYWKTDLRPTLADKVPTAGIDGAFWQHMTTFTVGLGVEGTVGESAAFAAIESEDTIIWPDPDDNTNDASDRIDDLLHAAVNGRGGFASAQSPEEFSREIKSFLETVVARAQTSASSAAVSAAVLRTDTLGFFAGFRSDDWSGTLSAFNFESGEFIWDAEETLRNKSPSERNIFTHDGTSAVSLLDIDDLSTVQQDALNADPDNPGSDDNLGQNRIDWIRGETGAASFRSRTFTPENGAAVTRLLGDIVNASPLFVGTPNYGFRRLNGDEGSSYSTFRSSDDYRDRTTAVYAASNNGLLHAFDSTTGNELFAYMPGELLEAGQNASSAQISTLISPDYAHRYFMDGSPTALDAYIAVDGETQWRTVLTGSMGVGGRTVFALDITDPDEFSADSVLWEFSDPDLGQGVTDVHVARLENGTWAAIFGNGYNGDDEKASLFVVDLADGSLIRQIETGAGGTANSNGLSTPVVTTFPETDGITRYAYAGDMLGNMWRFDLTGDGDDGSQWSTTKLFSAVGPGGNAQPITAAPAVTVNPSDLDELILSFGTGSFIRNGDDAFDEIQSFYAIRDDLTQSSLNRSDLLEQTITSQSSVQTPRADGTGTNTAVLRDTSNNELTDEQGWYLDLSVGGSKDGERVISQPTFPFGLTPDRVRFSTVIPDADPCSPGRTGFIMDLDIVSGGPPESPVFDLDSDGLFNTADIPGSGDDGDGDGVPDTDDQCSGTSTGVSVDSYGCGSGSGGDGGDGDGDGVPNIDDQCAGTSTGVSVNSYGCGPGINNGDPLAPSGIGSGDGTRITTIADASGQLEVIVDDPTQMDPGGGGCDTAICVFTGGDLGRQTWEQLR
jgi:type IV pilus assembly protein PilY1